MASLPDAPIDPRLADLAAVITGNLDREYPHQVVHAAPDAAAAPLAPPRQRHPIFFGCYDWHSAVHSHWALVRLGRADVVAARVTPDAVARELAYLAPRPRFELPYGLAWVLLLCAEAARAHPGLRAALAPLEAVARDRILGWARSLPAPIRAGEHSSSAFALALALEWARATGDAGAAVELAAVARAHHDGDRDAPWAYEPSAYDFLSPSLTTAWLMARALDDAGALAAWLDGFAPTLGRSLALAPPVAADRADGKLVHWDGLALSRAWMLRELAAALPAADPRVALLAAQASDHGARGLAALDGATYAGTHWLPSFAVYWLTPAASSPAPA
jgi:hypothetical protein